MDVRAAEQFLVDATRQADRWPAELAPGYARVDDRSVRDVMAFAARFGRLLRYYDRHNHDTGDWREFFTREPLVVLASIAATEVRDAERRIARLEQRTRSASTRERRGRGPRSKTTAGTARAAQFAQLMRTTLALPRDINDWLRGLDAPFVPDTVVPIRERIRVHVRTVLREPLRRLLHGNPWADPSIEWAPDWALDDPAPGLSIYQGVTVLDQIEQALPLIRPLWQPFGDAVHEWAALSADQLAEALKGSSPQRPHIALLAAFAEMFASVQASVNTLASRRAELYVRRILREQPRSAVADVAPVAFTCSSDRLPHPVGVPAGTLLAGGKAADGRDILFETEEEVQVTSLALQRVLTVHVVSAPGTGADGSPVVQRVLARPQAPTAATDSDGWPTFGHPSDTPATMGCVISSPLLALAGGERTVTLAVSYDLHARSLATLKALAAVTDQPPSAVLARLLRHACAVQVSTPDGWWPVAGEDVTVDVEREQAFRVVFRLHRSAPAVTPMPGLATVTPHAAVRLLLRQEEIELSGAAGAMRVYPLSVLDGLVVTTVTTDVAVTGLAPLQLSTMTADVVAASPWPPFGGVPAVGAALRVGHPELFVKPVTDLAVRLRWHDLPPQASGFRGYFREYVLDADGQVRADLYDNQVFRASLTVDGPSAWQIVAGGDDRYLFHTVDQVGPRPDREGALAAETTIDALTLAPSEVPAPAGAPPDTCLRLTLTAPEYAFGHALFARNARRAALAMAPSEPECDARCREQYARLLDARQRLQDLLTDLQRRRPFARAGRALSPRFWLTLPLRGISTVYLTVTRSWPARAAGGDADERASAVVSTHFADGHLGGPGPLPLLDRPAARADINARFDAIVRALLGDAESSLSAAMQAAQARAPRQMYQQWRRQLAEGQAQAATARLSGLRDLHRQLAGADAETGAGMLPHADVLLQAATWVHDCQAMQVDTQGWEHWRTVTTNLSTCIAALQRLHEKAVRQCKEICLRPTSQPLPNPPYLPQLAAVAIDYAATGPALFGHVLPFEGYSAMASTARTLLPRWAGQGSLYLGFSPASSPAPLLRLHVQCGQAGRPSAAWPRVSWDMLVDNSWMPLEVAASRDGTGGLQRSGIIDLPMPVGQADQSTILPTGLQWIRASVAHEADVFPPVVSIWPHATTARRRLTDRESADAGRALPAGTIVRPARPIRGIGAVIQPMPSRGGRSPESDRDLYLRTSERLRHRERASLGWDYERLVLERFPDLALVRVIPAGLGEDGGTVPPGQVRVVVMAGPEYPGITDRTAPTVSGDTLSAIARMLREAASPFVAIDVRNPVFVRVKVSAVVDWRHDAEGAAAAARVNAALVEALSPWQPRGQLSARSVSDLEAVVRGCPDVAAVHRLELSYEGAGPAQREAGRQVITSAREHDIRVLARQPQRLKAGY